MTLPAYKYRMCVKLLKKMKKSKEGKELSAAEATNWIERYCMDMTTRKIYNPQDYIKVEPYKRIFMWPENVKEAVGTMNLVPG